MNQTDELTFIFLGEKLPKYAVASLNLAEATSGMKVCIIGNRSIEKSVARSSVRFVAVEDFYDSREFSRASSRVWTDHRFRDGLWLKSLERLFVLHQYMRRFGLRSAIHAELDQILFQIQILSSKLDSINLSGVFLPFHNRDSAVASVLYVNDLEALASLLSFGSGEFFYPNEMHLIAEWAKSYPDLVFELPTVATNIHQRSESVIPGVKLLNSNETGGLLDAAQVGQWVGGIDPKNLTISKKPTTKFVDPPSPFLLNRDELSSIRFSFKPSNELLVSREGVGVEHNLFNLHIHSKIHSLITGGKLSLPNLIAIANSDQPVTIPSTRKKQINGWLTFGFTKLIDDPKKGFLFLFSRLNQKLGVHRSSSPLLTTDSFRAIANHVYDMKSELKGNQIVAGSIIYCDLDSWENFKSKVLPILDVPVVLIIGNSFLNIDANFFEDVNLPEASSIYAQNLLQEIQNVSPFPVGLENRRMAKYGFFSSFPKVSSPRKTKIFKIAWNFSIGENPHDRTRAALALMSSPNAVKLQSGLSTDYLKELSTFGFVACPPGKSLDTNLIWEALYLGCIPVVIDSYLARYFQSLHLPVWVVESFNEIVDFSEAELADRYHFIQRNSSDVELQFDSWQNRIASSVVQAKSC
jgi:hypothetical protein